MLFVAFGVDFGNLRRQGHAQLGMDDLCRSWNEKLRVGGASARVAHWWHKTGNFVIDAVRLDVSGVTNVLRGVSGGKHFAVFGNDEFVSWLSDMKGAAQSPPSDEPGRSWTPGMVMDTDPGGSIPPHVAAAAPIRFGHLARPRLRFAWRSDIFRSGRTTLDPQRREGGWGRAATEMRRHAGGVWTARALSRPTDMIDDFERSGPRMGTD